MPSQHMDNDEPTTGPSKRLAIALWLAIAAVVAALIAYHLMLSHRLAGQCGFPLDDSWIHVRFAENLARGEGFAFNHGEPTSTTTSALWTLLLALAYRVTHEHLFTSIVLNGALCLLLCAVVYHLSLTLVPRRWLAAAAAAAVAVTVPLPWWALSGMEPPLYAVLSLLGILLHMRLRRARGPRALLPTIVFAFAGLARPECFLLFPLAMIDRLVVSRWVERDSNWAARWAKHLALHIPLFALIVAPLFIYNYRVTGYPLPSSYYSKLQWMSVSGALAADRVSILDALFTGPWFELRDLVKVWTGNNLALILPFFVGLAWVTLQAFSPSKHAHRSLLIPMLLILQPVAWTLFAGYRPPGFQSQRYLAALNPLFLLLGLIGGWWITERASALRRPWVRALLFLVVLTASLARQPAAALTYARNVKNTTGMQVAIGRWVQKNVPPGSLLAVNDVGAIGVISDCPVLDLQGLVTPEILSRRDIAHRAAGTAPLAVFEFIVQRRPDYLIIFPEWYPELHFRRDLFTPVHEVLLTDNITCGAAWMVVYRTIWASTPRQETDTTP